MRSMTPPGPTTCSCAIIRKARSPSAGCTAWDAGAGSTSYAIPRRIAYLPSTRLAIRRPLLGLRHDAYALVYIRHWRIVNALPASDDRRDAGIFGASQGVADGSGAKGARRFSSRQSDSGRSDAGDRRRKETALGGKRKGQKRRRTRDHVLWRP